MSNYITPFAKEVIPYKSNHFVKDMKEMSDQFERVRHVSLLYMDNAINELTYLTLMRNLIQDESWLKDKALVRKLAATITLRRGEL